MANDFSTIFESRTSAAPEMIFKLAKRTTYFARATSSLTPGQWGRTTSFRTTDDAFARSRDLLTEAAEAVIRSEAYPNPFRDEIVVLVTTGEDEEVVVSMVDLTGRVVQVPENDQSDEEVG